MTSDLLMDFLGDIAVGAVSPGTNIATFIALNVVLLLVIISLIPLLAYSLTSNVALLPHVLVLIFLAVGLWGLMIWLIGVVGVVKTEEQQATNGDGAALSSSSSSIKKEA